MNYWVETTSVCFWEWSQMKSGNMRGKAAAFQLIGKVTIISGFWFVNYWWISVTGHFMSGSEGIVSFFRAEKAGGKVLKCFLSRISIFPLSRGQMAPQFKLETFKGSQRTPQLTCHIHQSHNFYTNLKTGMWHPWKKTTLRICWGWRAGKGKSWS